MNFMYEPLMKNQIEDIHQATLDVLEKCGVEMHHPKAIEIFKQHGATVEGNVIKIPHQLVESALKTVPNHFILEAVDPEYNVQIGHGPKPLLGPNSTSPFMIDGDFKRRNVTVEDLRNYFKLSETSKFVDVGSNLMVFPVEDCSYKDATFLSTYEYFLHMTKPFGLGGGGYKTASMADEILQVLIEKRDAYSMYVSLSPISPLRYENDILEGLFRTIELNQVVQCVPCSATGMTGPIKAIDNVVLTNAENLGMMVLVQLVKPGAPFFYSTYTAISDMRTLQLATGAPETFKMLNMARSMCTYYDIPFEMPSGNTDAKALDCQASMESTMGVFNAYLSNTDCCTFMFGSLDTFNSGSLEKFILDEEIIHNVQEYFKPTPDLRENVSDIITEVGHHGTYVRIKDTMRNYRKEHS